MLKKKNVEINGEKFVVSEISVGVILPILPRLQGEPQEQQDAQIDMMRQCIFIGDKPIGDDLMEIGLSAYLQLAEEMMKINGLEADEKGKD